MTNTYSDEWRRECEARWVMAALPVSNKGQRKKRTTRMQYINEVERVRGKQAADQLKRDIKREWDKQRATD